MQHYDPNRGHRVAARQPRGWGGYTYFQRFDAMNRVQYDKLLNDPNYAVTLDMDDEMHDETLNLRLAHLFGNYRLKNVDYRDSFCHHAIHYIIEKIVWRSITSIEYDCDDFYNKLEWFWKLDVLRSKIKSLFGHNLSYILLPTIQIDPIPDGEFDFYYAVEDAFFTYFDILQFCFYVLLLIKMIIYLMQTISVFFNARNTKTREKFNTTDRKLQNRLKISSNVKARIKNLYKRPTSNDENDEFTHKNKMTILIQNLRRQISDTKANIKRNSIKKEKVRLLSAKVKKSHDKNDHDLLSLKNKYGPIWVQNKKVIKELEKKQQITVQSLETAEMELQIFKKQVDFFQPTDSETDSAVFSEGTNSTLTFLIDEITEEKNKLITIRKSLASLSDENVAPKIVHASENIIDHGLINLTNDLKEKQHSNNRLTQKLKLLQSKISADENEIHETIIKNSRLRYQIEQMPKKKISMLDMETYLLEIKNFSTIGTYKIKGKCPLCYDFVSRLPTYQCQRCRVIICMPCLHDWAKQNKYVYSCGFCRFQNHDFCVNK